MNLKIIHFCKIRSNVIPNCCDKNKSRFYVMENYVTCNLNLHHFTCFNMLSTYDAKFNVFFYDCVHKVKISCCSVYLDTDQMNGSNVTIFFGKFEAIFLTIMQIDFCRSITYFEKHIKIFKRISLYLIYSSSVFLFCHSFVTNCSIKL